MKPIVTKKGKLFIPPTQPGVGPGSSISFTTPTGGGTANIQSNTISTVTFNTQSPIQSINLPKVSTGTMYTIHNSKDSDYSIITTKNKQSFLLNEVKLSMNITSNVLNVWDDLMELIYFMDIGVSVKRKTLLLELEYTNKKQHIYVDMFLKVYIINGYLEKTIRGIYTKIKHIEKDRTEYLFKKKKELFNMRKFKEEISKI